MFLGPGRFSRWPLGGVTTFYMREKIVIVLEIKLMTRSALEPDYIIICTFNFWVFLVNMTVNQVLMFQINSRFSRTKLADK